jgi:LysM repeat protein
MDAYNAYRQSGRRHRRTRIAEWVIVLVLGAAVLGACFAGTAHTTNGSTATVMVRPGDTLWNLAARADIPGMTTAEAVDVIADLNGLGSATLVTGTSLRVPVVDARTSAVAMQ